MFFTEKKLAKRIEELDSYRYRDIIKFSKIRFQLDEKGEVGQCPPLAGNWQEVKIGERWRGRDKYAWIAIDTEIPAEWKEKQIVGRFDFGLTGGGHNSGFESLLFLNGSPYQGVDSNHQEVFFSADLAGKKLDLKFRLWSGLEGGGQPREMEHKFKKAELSWLDETADDLYFTGKAVLETINIMSENEPDRARLLQLVNRSFNMIDWARPGSEDFYHTIYQAQQKLRSGLDKMDKHTPIKVNCIGHTHIDVAWLWRLKHTREKCARSFSTVLRLMDKYPEYIFLQSQPQLYDYIKNDYPDIYEKIKEKVEEGRWEADGAMWVEADCNITSGESLVRQILLGKRFFKEEFGVENKFLWLPDVFGYSWALPQILKKSGLDTFMTTKISWNQYNRMPHDTFMWKGIDGTEILTHFISTPTKNQSEDSWFYTYNGHITPDTVVGIWKQYQDKEINQELLLSYGYGDGGGGVNREMLESRARVDEIPGLPEVKTGRAGEYFDRLHQQLEKTDEYIHTWNGELYLEYHRGTYTSQAYNKRMNRKLELLYRETEWMNVLRSIKENKWASYPQQNLNDGWKIILRNQFHDIIPGSSIREVYQDSREEYAEAEKIANKNWQNAGTALLRSEQSNEKVYTLFNSANWVRDDIISIPARDETTGNWYDNHQNKLASQLTDSEWQIQLEEIPATGFTYIIFREEEVNQEINIFDIKDSIISTPYYQIEWNESGQLTNIYDRENKRQVLADGIRGNVLQVFEDKPINHDAWDIDIYYQEKMREVRDLKSVKIIEKGPLRCVIRFSWEYMDSTINQDMTLYSKNRRIDFKTHVDWHEQHQLLKVAFPVSIHSAEATYDIQFGNVKRPTHWNTSWDYARFETVGHQWVDLSERGYGVSLLNDCKYGHDIKDNVIRLSLIKSATSPDIEADRGEHIFTYSLYPHSGDWCQGKTVQAAWELNNPMHYLEGQPNLDEFSLFTIDANNILIDSIKKAEDEDKVILRIHEYGGGRESVSISSDLAILSWQECDLMEEVVTDPNIGEFRFDIKPYEIKSFIVEIDL